MDLDQAKFFDSSTSWARIGMLVCFAVAAGILMLSIWMPTTARAIGQNMVLHRTL